MNKALLIIKQANIGKPLLLVLTARGRVILTRGIYKQIL